MKYSEHEKQAVIFLSLVGSVFLVVAVLFFLGLLTSFVILLIILGILILIYTQLEHFFAQLQEYERAVVFRMGKFKEVFGPGWLFLIPFVETYTEVDLRVKTYDIQPQDVVTEDNIKLMMDAIIYAHVKDAKSAILNVDDYENSLKSYVRATLRSVVGKMKLTDVISEISQVNQILQESLQHVSDAWGIKVVKVEIQSLELPKTLQEAMHEKAAAEQHKMAQIQKAEAKKLTIDAIQDAAGKLTNPTLQYMYLQSLEKIAEGKSSKIIFPMELTKIAEQLSGKLGGFAKAEDIVQKKYHEKVVETKSTQDALKALVAEYGVQLPEPPAKKKKKR